MSSLLGPKLLISLLLENRRELITRSDSGETRRDLLFGAKTTQRLEINGVAIRSGRVVVHCGHQAYQGQNIAGAIEYYEAYEDDPAYYLVTLWTTDPKAFEDLLTYEEHTVQAELHLSAGPKDRNTIDVDLSQWNAKAEKSLVVSDWTTWISAGPLTDPGAIETPPPARTPFETELLTRVASLEKNILWCLGALIVLIFLLWTRR